MYNPIYESVDILVENTEGFSRDEAKALLMEASSPVTMKYHERLYQSAIDKAHIDFGDIPKSAGVISKYSGYGAMTETLNVMKDLATQEKALEVLNYVAIVFNAIQYISDLSGTYSRGFQTRTTYVALEYNTYVYTCVQATTALINGFIEYVKSPDTKLIEMKIKNTKLRADEFYFEQLKKFNMIQEDHGIEYRKMLESMIDKGKQNFTGPSDLAVGIGVITIAALSIIPITRELIYQTFRFRGKLSDHLELQATFLEMNKATIENNGSLTPERKLKVMKKQEKLAGVLRKLSDSIRVKSTKSIVDAKSDLKKDNKEFDAKKMKSDIADADIDFSMIY